MWSPHKEYLALGNTRRLRLKAYQQLFLSEMGSELITNIRNALNTDLVLGRTLNPLIDILLAQNAHDFNGIAKFTNAALVDTVQISFGIFADLIIRHCAAFLS